MKKYCTRCGKQFDAVGREVICPSCKAQAAEETKKAAVLKAKRASWTGESVPVRISGRASTVIRDFGASHTMPFAEALDTLLRTSDYFKGVGIAWQDVEPYKSHRRKSTTEDEQEVKPASKPQGKPQGKPQAAKTTSKPQTAKATSKASKSVSTK